MQVNNISLYGMWQHSVYLKILLWYYFSIIFFLLFLFNAKNISIHFLNEKSTFFCWTIRDDFKWKKFQSNRKKQLNCYHVLISDSRCTLLLNFESDARNLKFKTVKKHALRTNNLMYEPNERRVWTVWMPVTDWRCEQQNQMILYW